MLATRRSSIPPSTTGPRRGAGWGSATTTVSCCSAAPRRAHKGIAELLEAAERLGDERVRVAVFGTRELDQLRRELGSLERWILPLPNPSFDELPIVLAAADIACALQSPDHPVSRYQMPAKVTDAMAMGVPCLVTPVPPLQSLIDKDVLEVFDGADALDERLHEIFEHFDDARDRARQARELFLESYSYAAVRPVLAEAIERHLDDPPPMAAAAVRDRRHRSRPVRCRATRWMGQAVSDPVSKPLQSRRPVPPGSQYDLVVFWKQNDTGVYGRRQDMFLKYLERSGRFHTIVHFDEPMSVEGLWNTARNGRGEQRPEPTRRAADAAPMSHGAAIVAPCVSARSSTHRAAIRGRHAFHGDPSTWTT